jgi:hypothetical protein
LIEPTRSVPAPGKKRGGLTGLVSRPSFEPRKDVSVSSCDTKTSSGAEKKGYPPELE